MRRVAAGVAIGFVMIVAGQAHAAVGASDNFNRSDGPIGTATSGQAWVQANGTWVVKSGAAMVTNAGHISEATVPTGLSDKYKVAADITLSPTPLRANAGLAAQYKDHADGLFCKTEVTAGHKGGFMSIGKILNGAGNSLLAYKTKVGVKNGGTYHMEFSKSGTTLTCTVSGGGLASPSTITYKLTKSENHALRGAMAAGLRARWDVDEDDGLSKWDNFSVTATP
jgi:hypothetical protein